MQRTSKFIVEKSKIILAVFALLVACCLVLMTKVNINADLTKYLPDDSPTKIGMEIMDSEFPPASTFSIMFRDLDEDEKQAISSGLSGIQNVMEVLHESGSEKYEKDGYTLYTVNLEVAANTPEAKASVDEAKEKFSAYKPELNGDAAGNTVIDILPQLAGAAFILLFIILIIMCESWIEPILFMVCIAMAIVLNMGSNVIFGEISEITNSIAAILQLCLSMDYSIMLLNRYRQEKKSSENKNEAMKKALQKSFRAISSSSITTVAGMLALAFMSFTIGRDMGFVLAKGVFLSLVCIFTILPALILIFDGLIEKSAKRSIPLKMDKIASLSYKLRYGVLAFFIALFALCFFLRGNVSITYTMTEYEKINRVFLLDNSIVVLYRNEDEDRVGPLAEKWKENSFAESVGAYATTLGKKLSSDEAAEAFGMDKTTSALLYSHYMDVRGEETGKKIALGEFLQFLMVDAAENGQLAPLFTGGALTQLSSAMPSMPPEMMAQEFSSAEFAAFTQIGEGTAELLYNLYAIMHGDLPEEKISIIDFTDFIIDDVSENEQFKPFFSNETLSEIKESRAALDDALKQLVGENYSRIAITARLPVESDETIEFLSGLKQDLAAASAGENYIIGNSAMADELRVSFPSELNIITLISVAAIFIIIAIAFKSMVVPVILVCIIQCAVFAAMGLTYLQGSSIYYLPLLIVQCLLLGSTVDYGILLTSYYREARNALDVKQAVSLALNNSIHTVMTSALILILLTIILGIMLSGSDPAISEILQTVGKGGICATALVVLILPGILVALDKFVAKA
ncbi:MAG: MMPL family transporter [Clostridiales bacterium]|jgi:predicted RND superfamily exporter protein|nr:MMPL family transporter [Clostridiales bacterium]